MTPAPPSILLVEPNPTGNLGAAARVLANFGLTQLRAVGSPELPGVRDFKAARAEGRGLLERLAALPRPATLEEALRTSGVAIAATRRSGKHRPTDLHPDDLVPFVAALPPDTPATIVFGREAWGLTDDEVDLCGWRLTIPTMPEARSLNLAQAVAIVAWAWFSGVAARAEPPTGAPQAEVGTSADPADAGTPDPAARQRRRHRPAREFKELSERPAPVGEVRAFLDQLAPGLERIGFLEGSRGPDALRSLHRIFSRAGLTEREVRLLRGLARKLDPEGSD